MKHHPNYIDINRHSWNNRTETHLQSTFYDVKGFLEGKSSLHEIELGLLGNVHGKSVLHLQCHFGLDTLSLGRLGAEVTGVDLSDKSIEAAKHLAQQTSMAAEFICCNIYDLPDRLSKSFDVVYTSYGTIGWLPDLERWAQIIAHFLKPGGHFVFVEFHPVLSMFDDDFKIVANNYFNTGPIVETEEGTYTDRDAAITQEFVWWNHSLSEVITSMLSSGLRIQSFQEYDYSPYNCFRNMTEAEPGKFRISHMNNNLPMTYAISAVNVQKTRESGDEIYECL